MKYKFIDKLAGTFEVPVPEGETLDEFLDNIIPAVRPWSEDLREEAFYLDKPWLELRDDDRFHDTVLHFFNEGGEYLQSVNGDVGGGSWRYLERANKFLIEEGGAAELYDLAFLSDFFFILRKHGDLPEKIRPKYFFMVLEARGRGLEWRDACEELFNTYRKNNSFWITLLMIIMVIVAIIVILSMR